MAITVAMRTQVSQLYVSLFGRAPDGAGLGYWVTQLDNGQSLTQLANAMYGVSEARAYYPAFATPEEIVQTFYTNVLGRAKGTDLEGQAFWVAKLKAPGVSVGSVIVDLQFQTANYTGTDPAGVASKALYNNKVSVAQYFGEQNGSVAGATNALTGVTSDVATVATAKTSVDSAVSSGSGQPFTLTTGADTPSSTAFNDTYNAVIGTSLGATDGTTLNPGDNINGGAGLDTLSLSISGTHAAAVTDSAFTLNSIETLSISNFETSANDTTLDMSLATGVATVNLNASSATGDTVLTNLKNIVAAQMQNGAGDLNLGYQTAVVSGTADTQTLLVSGVTGGTFTANGVETLAITSSGSARNVLTGVTNDASLKAITVAGSTALTLGTLGAAVTSLNASGSTGGVTATLSATTTTAVVGSSGNDSFTSGTVLTTGSVNAGDGIDTLVTTADNVVNTSALGLKYTGFETFSVLNVAAAASDRAQDMSLLSGITTLNATTQDTTTNTGADTTQNITFSNLAATTNTLNITRLSSAEAGAGIELTATVSATRASDTLADAMTVNLGSNAAGTTAAAASGATIAALGGAAGGVVLAVSLANEETITINSLGGANFIGTLTDTSAKVLNITGAQALTINSLTSGVMTTLDASAMTANLTINGNSGTTASTITGGSGNDTLLGSTKADTINGGAGNDSITAGAGADSVSGGDGDDTFTVSTITDFTLALETVNGGAGNDTLSFTEAATTTLTAANLTGISGIEQISIANGANAISVTLTDAVYTANGQALKIIDGTLTGGALTLDGSALSAANVVDVTANTSTNVNDSLVGGAANDIFRFSATTGLEAGDSVTGGAGTDTIILAASAADVTAVLTNVRTVENITTTGTGRAIGITVGASTMAASTTLTTNASAQSTSTGALTYDGSAVALTTVVQNVTGTGANDNITGGAGNDIIVGGSGDDAITGGLGIDSLSGGDGVDTFTVATLGAGFVGLTAAETVNGGAGNDILTFAAGTLVVASTDLLGLSSVETITVQNTTQTASITLTDQVFTVDGLSSLTVDNVTATTGVLTLAAGSLSAANSVKVLVSKSDNSGALNIVLGAGNDSVVIDGDAVDNASTLTGGAGTDTLEIVRQTTTTTAAIASTITGFENVLFSTAAGTYAFSTADANVASGATQTVNASAMTGTLLWNGSLELDGQFSITTGSGADSLTGGAKNDTISGGAGSDTITGGLGADVLTGGAGTDYFVYSLGSGFSTSASNATTTDTITDWTSGTDDLNITLNYSTIASNLTVDATIQTARAGTGLIQDNLSGARGQVAYDTVGNAAYINVNSDNLLTTADFKINLNPASTATATLAEGDINFNITGGVGSDTITAGGGIDTIDGGAGADSITGGAGNDVLTGGTGADTIVGGNGSDTVDLTSETAVLDTYVFTGTAITSAEGNMDTITNFYSASTANSADLLLFGSAFTGGVAFGSGAYNVLASNSVTSANSASIANKIIDVTGSLAAYSGEAAAVTLFGSAFSNAANEKAIFLLDNGTNTYIYYVDDNFDGVATTVTAADVVLIGIINGFTGTDFGAGQFGTAV